MIEILQIFFQLSLFIFLTSFPFNKYLFLKNTLIRNTNYFTSLSINSLFLMFLLLIFSFFKIDLINVFFSILSIYLILFLKILFNRKFFFDFKELPLILFFIFSLLCISLNTAFYFELGWDGFAWKQKANFFYNGGYLFDIKEYHLLDFQTYLNYPHLGTYIWAFFWKNSFINYEYIGRLFFNYIYIVSLFAVISNFKYLNYLKKIFLFILIFFCTFDTGLGGYQEYIIFSILTIFVTILVGNYFNNNNFLFYFAFALSGILLPWIKTEGLVYSFFLIVIFLVYEFQFSKNKKSNTKYFFVLLIILSSFIRIFINEIILDGNILFHNNFINFIKSNFTFELIFSNIYYILYYILNSFFKYPIWLFNLIGLILSIYFYKNLKILGIFLIFFVLNFLFIFAIYVTTPTNITWYLSASLDRLLLQTSGFYFVLFSLIPKKIYK